MAMSERTPTFDPNEVTKKWDEIIKSGQQLTDADLFNLGLDILRSRMGRKMLTNHDEVELISTSGQQVVLAYFPQDPEMPESLWIEINKGKKPVSYDIQRQNDGFRIFFLEGLEKGDPQLISILTGKTRIEIAQRLLEAHKLTPLKRGAVVA